MSHDDEQWKQINGDDYDSKATMEAVDKFSKSMAHYGTPRHSGRYPYGSGENPYQHELDFIGHVEKLKRQGLSEKEIAYSMSMKTSELRKTMANSRAKVREYERSEARRLMDKGMSRSAVARRMGIPESTLRGYEDEDRAKRMTSAARNAKVLKEIVDADQFGFIDVGAGVEHHLGISKHALGNALKQLQDEGYEIQNVQFEQLGTGKQTTVKVLCPPGTTKWDVRKNMDKIKPPVELYSEDGGQTLRKLEPPVSVDSKRVAIRYAEDGGTDKDGVIELRRGVEDISLKNANYAQVRIAVDDKCYLKGMAVYSDKLPPGVDILFNTNKHKGTPMFDEKDPDHSVLKPLKNDPDNPFGATIMDDDPEDRTHLVRAQRHYIGADGKEHQSALNIVSEEGTWYNWNRTLASQFLSKQPPAMAKQQLDLALNIAKDEMKEIQSYTNPLVRAKMLEEFATKVESDSVHLSAAALPRQSTRVILPLTNTKDTEIYAPGYQDGEQVALVRYPHAGIMEIPILTVNNKNREAQRIMGTNPLDAVGINSTVAARLSGADFDGDTVLVLPTNNVKIRATANNRPADYKSLEDFDGKAQFPEYPGMHLMNKQERGQEMGKITNLITDMTIRGATDAELCRAIKHSMVVIDAYKHHLDYKGSEEAFNIAELREKYQGKASGGSSTFLSRSTGPEYIPERRLKAPSKMSPEEHERYLNGEQIWQYTGYDGAQRTKRVYEPDRKLLTKDEKKAYDDADSAGKRELEKQFRQEGKMKRIDKPVQVEVEKGMVNDPWDLVSHPTPGTTTRIEAIYAQYATNMKELARQARAIARNTDIPKRDPDAAKEYSEEVKSLTEKLERAEANAPRERQAQIIADTKFRVWKYEHPEEYDDNEHRKRKKGQLLDASRKSIGAKKVVIGSSKSPLTDREWEAIQKNAISPSLLSRILSNSDTGRIKELSSPRTKTGLPASKLARAKAMIAKGYSREDICNMLDISESKLINAIGIENF